MKDHQFRKIINDPVYGFITIDHPLLARIIAHPYYQRLRRIHQMAFAHLVYPGAVHTRLHHSLGAYHLMGNALAVLESKGVEITADEAVGAKIAILLHDCGHGPFSHALENILIPGVSHEDISISLMQAMDTEFNGALHIALAIFTNRYHKPFLRQLVSGQLDVDRMDYLTRDSFYTGVSEGVIGYDRIIKMLAVREGALLVEEKAIYSIEKFLVARRLMYWQVYLHKAVLSAEKILVKIIERAMELTASGHEVPSCSQVLDFFLQNNAGIAIGDHLPLFCRLDDYDVMSAIKNWMVHKDPVLSYLSRFLIDRHLLKVTWRPEPFDQNTIDEKRTQVCAQLHIPENLGHYFVFNGEIVNTTYDPSDERINILFKNESIKDISQVDNALIHQTLASPVKKFYLCYYSDSLV